jgi:glutamine amidotransferase-like uncharacterized protein
MNIKFKVFLLVVFVVDIGSITVSATHSLKKSPTTQNVISSKKMALVYKGPGSCVEECSEAAAHAARLAGYESQFVGPNEDNAELFKNAAIWIQPGGESIIVSKNLNKKLIKLVQDFVFQGGAYVGFCAGGFLATDVIDDTEHHGFGLIKAESKSFDPGDESARFLNIKWNRKMRNIYWEGGPYFDIPKKEKDSVHIIAEYPNGTPFSIASRFGKGTVIVTGGHPEAPKWWEDDIGFKDADGIDNDLAAEMISNAIEGRMIKSQ